MRSVRTIRPMISLDQRATIILLHPTSLPGPHGSGDLGVEAHKFANFAADAGFGWWQMLPTGTIGPGNSPYSSTSAFAGNPLLIDLRALVTAGYLTESQIVPVRSFRDDRVNFPAVMRFRMKALMLAYEAFRDNGGVSDKPYRTFCEKNADWLDDFAMYEAARELHDGDAWVTWDADLRDRKPEMMTRFRDFAADLIESHKFVQYLFFSQWNALRQTTARRDLGLIGDIPIFNAYESCDVWANRELYMLDKHGKPTELTGCPPDGFSADGQFWGHPQYNWEAHAQSGFAWWIARFRHMLTQFDAVRIDHFLGFHRAWWIKAGAKTGRNGRYVPSPGDDLFTAVREALGELNIIAEDLGDVTAGAFALRDKFGFPGMRILTGGFGSDHPGAQYHLPHNYPANSVAYTGTHDNQTLVGWLEQIQKKTGKKRRNAKNATQDRVAMTEFARVLRYLGKSDAISHWDIIRALYASHANLVGVPLQDALGLNAKHRMNSPGTATGNWGWRVPAELVTHELGVCLRELAATYGRIPQD